MADPATPSTPSTPSPPVLVLPHRRIPGWTGLGEPDEVFGTTPLLEALETQHTTDAHFVCYAVPVATDHPPEDYVDPPYEQVIPRLCKSAAGPLAKDGAEPVLLIAAIDIDNPKHKTWDDGGGNPYGATRAQCLSTLGLMYPGAIAYTTRAGARLLWVLDKPIPASHADAFLRWLISTVPHADPACKDWTRLFRLPFVVRDGVRTDGELIGWADPSARLATPELHTLPKKAPRVPAMRADTGSGPEAILDDEARHYLLLGLNRRSGKFDALKLKLFAMEPLARPGHRDAAMFRATNLIMYQLRDLPELHHEFRKGVEAYVNLAASWIYAILLPCIEADVTDDAPTADDLWVKAVRAAEEVAGDVIAGNPQHPDHPDNARPKDNAHATRPTPPADDQRTGDSDSVVLDATPEDPPPFIGFDGSYFVRLADHLVEKWRGPIRSSALPTVLARHYPDIPLGTATTTISATTLQRMHGEEANAVLYTLEGVDRWDEETSTLRTSRATIARPTPTYHKDVHRWLTLLGGDKPERLFDWLAVAHRTDQPTAALYVEGPARIGKGMLVAALAAQWAADPVPFRVALDQFNHDMTRCPIISLDESWGQLSSKDSGTFRALITESTRTVRQLYTPGIQLEGCVRLIITANNPDAIQLSGSHTSEDVDAISGRILHVKAGPEAAAFLEGMGGRTHTTDAAWVRTPNGKPGRVVEHLAWLQANRAVVPGPRLLVEGGDGKGGADRFGRRLLASNDLHSQILLALAKAVAANLTPGSPLRFRGVEMKEKDEETNTPAAVWVNVTRLHARWGTLVKEEAPKPTTSALLRAIKSISSGGESKIMRLPSDPMAPMRCWPVDPDLVQEASDEFGLAESDILSRIFSGRMPKVVAGR